MYDSRSYHEQTTPEDRALRRRLADLFVRRGLVKTERTQLSIFWVKVLCERLLGARLNRRAAQPGYVWVAQEHVVASLEAHGFKFNRARDRVFAALAARPLGLTKVPPTLWKDDARFSTKRPRRS